MEEGHIVTTTCKPLDCGDRQMYSKDKAVTWISSNNISSTTLEIWRCVLQLEQQ